MHGHAAGSGLTLAVVGAWMVVAGNGTGVYLLAAGLAALVWAAFALRFPG